MSKGVFITGTDTGVGKTVVSAVIIRALIKKGIKVGAMKPMETGCIKTENREQGTEERLLPSDGMFLKEMAEMEDSIDLVTPIRFEYPLAPMVASDLEKKPVDIDKALKAYKTLSKKYEFMVVEGVGGLLVPLTLRQGIGTSNSSVYFLSDLINDLGLPILIVARPTLGTINHTLLTIREAKRCGIKVNGVIINYSSQPEDNIIEKTNPDVLKKLSPVPVIGIVPYIKDINKHNIESRSEILLPAMREIIQNY